jgi:hypothetical protein
LEAVQLPAKVSAKHAEQLDSQALLWFAAAPLLVLSASGLSGQPYCRNLVAN